MSENDESLQISEDDDYQLIIDMMMNLDLPDDPSYGEGEELQWDTGISTSTVPHYMESDSPIYIPPSELDIFLKYVTEEFIELTLRCTKRLRKVYIFILLLFLFTLLQLCTS